MKVVLAFIVSLVFLGPALRLRTDERALQPDQMTFFVTSVGLGDGAKLGGLAGADAHCLALASAAGAGNHRWRAYLSTSAATGQPAVNARDRIGPGPWRNAKGVQVAANLAELHSDRNNITKETALTERGATVNGRGDTPNMHDILTGSNPDGTASPDTCNNWTSNGRRQGRAQVGHHDRKGSGSNPTSWNSAHRTAGCSQYDLQVAGGAGLFYCFGIRMAGD